MSDTDTDDDDREERPDRGDHAARDILARAMWRDYRKQALNGLSQEERKKRTQALKGEWKEQKKSLRLRSHRMLRWMEREGFVLGRKE